MNAESKTCDFGHEYWGNLCETCFPKYSKPSPNPVPANVEDLKQDFKELNLYLDQLCINGHEVKDAGNLWIQFSDKFRAFEKRVLAAIRTVDVEEAAKEWATQMMGIGEYDEKMWHYADRQMWNTLVKAVKYGSSLAASRTETGDQEVAALKAEIERLKAEIKRILQRI